jgi:hypothetical protein
MGTMPLLLSPSPNSVLSTIRALLSSRSLSLAEISRQSRSQFSTNAQFWIPSNFYDALHHVSFSPSLHQFFALSVLTGYRLMDWLHVFGFSFDAPSRFQAAWPRYQTVELDARVYDTDAEVAWYEETPGILLGEELTPLNHWLAGKTMRRLDRLSDSRTPKFRYLKIGTGDAYAYPDLLPGSVVRVDIRVATESLLREPDSKRILAIEHSRGITCSRFRPSGPGRIILCSRQVPYAPVEMTLGTEARILGVVDLEIRNLAYRGTPTVSSSAARHWSPAALRRSEGRGRIGDYLRQARIRSRLSFHETSERTREIARVLNHPNYFCAASALCDMEARDLFPRHIHKLISLSAVYCLPVAELAALAGLPSETAGREKMPEQLIKVRVRQPENIATPVSSFWRAVETRFEQIPFFLRGALPDLLGLPNLSVRDLFWAGATARLAHPYLRDAAFLAVNRKSKTPAPSLASPVWAQPLYVLELRDGSRICAACTLQNGILLIRPGTTAVSHLIRLQNHIDVEVLGRVAALLRSVKGAG